MHLLKKDENSYNSIICLVKLYRFIFLTSLSIRLNYNFFYFMRTYFFARIYSFFFRKFRRDILFRNKLKKLLYLLYSNYKDSYFSFDSLIYPVRGARCFFIHNFVCRNFFIVFKSKEKFICKSAGLSRYFGSGGSYRHLRHTLSHYTDMITSFFYEAQSFLQRRVNIIFKTFSLRISLSIRVYMNFFKLANQFLGSKIIRLENIFIRRGRAFSYGKTGLKTGTKPARKRYLSQIKSRYYY